MIFFRRNYEIISTEVRKQLQVPTSLASAAQYACLGSVPLLDWVNIASHFIEKLDTDFGVRVLLS